MQKETFRFHHKVTQVSLMTTANCGAPGSLLATFLPSPGRFLSSDETDLFKWWHTLQLDPVGIVLAGPPVALNPLTRKGTFSKYPMSRQ